MDTVKKLMTAAEVSNEGTDNRKTLAVIRALAAEVEKLQGVAAEAKKLRDTVAKTGKKK